MLPVPFFPLISAPFFFCHSGFFRRFFFFSFPVEFPIPVLNVSSSFLRGSKFSHKLILHLHRLVHLTRLYYSSVCKVLCDLFYLFLFSMFLNEGRIVFSLLMILFTFSRFIFCSCDCVSSWLLDSVSFGILEVWSFHLLKFADLFHWIVFVRHHLISLVLYYIFLNVFFDGFLVIQVQKTNLS